MRFAWARVFSAYGPWDHADTLIMHCIASLLRGEKPALTACEQRWDYLHIQDVGRALFLIGEKGRDGSAYNIGSGQARPLRDYVEIVRDAIDPSLPLGLGEVPYAPGQVMHLCADIASLSADTGFLPAISFDEGIRQTIAWYQGATR
jgi:nucleoside-diphosphate-sugar epimerase